MSKIPYTVRKRTTILQNMTSFTPTATTAVIYSQLNIAFSSYLGFEDLSMTRYFQVDPSLETLVIVSPSEEGTLDADKAERHRDAVLKVCEPSQQIYTISTARMGSKLKGLALDDELRRSIDGLNTIHQMFRDEIRAKSKIANPGGAFDPFGQQVAMQIDVLNTCENLWTDTCQHRVRVQFVPLLLEAMIAHAKKHAKKEQGSNGWLESLSLYKSTGHRGFKIAIISTPCAECGGAA